MTDIQKNLINRSVDVSNVLPDLITAAELAAKFKITPKTLRLWVQQGMLPAPRKVGSVRFWTTAELRASLRELERVA